MKADETSVTWIYLNLRKTELCIFKGSAEAEKQYVFLPGRLLRHALWHSGSSVHKCKKQSRMMFYLMSVNLLPFDRMTAISV